MALSPGTKVGPYEIVGALGAGGMGEVYRARDTRLGRDVAIKVLATSVAADEERRQRFEREAQIVATLSHPNVLTLFDYGVADGRAYAVTELLEGETLRERLTPGAIPSRKAIEYAVQIARGLSSAHDKALVHRDLKPENIFLLADGRLKILDFGLARQTASPEGNAETVAALTDPGTVMGTVGYMAPEQVRGGAVDARADLFAFGGGAVRDARRPTRLPARHGRRDDDRNPARRPAGPRRRPGRRRAGARPHRSALPREESSRAVPDGA